MLGEDLEWFTTLAELERVGAAAGRCLWFPQVWGARARWGPPRTRMQRVSTRRGVLTQNRYRLHRSRSSW